MIGWSTSQAASNVKISAEKVFPHQETCGSDRLGQAVRLVRDGLVTRTVFPTFLRASIMSSQS